VNAAPPPLSLPPPSGDVVAPPSPEGCWPRRQQVLSFAQWKSGGQIGADGIHLYAPLGKSLAKQLVIAQAPNNQPSSQGAHLKSVLLP
jgi:hypothetical protein